MAMFDITENDQFDAVAGKQGGKKEEPKKYCCEECGAQFKPFSDPKMNKWNSAKDAFDQVKKKYGKAICRECREKSKSAQEELKND
jgi:formylmethanofuran dehydrogenase subunit E